LDDNPEPEREWKDMRRNPHRQDGTQLIGYAEIHVAIVDRLHSVLLSHGAL
jgi:hypothetical protein